MKETPSLPHLKDLKGDPKQIVQWESNVEPVTDHGRLQDLYYKHHNKGIDSKNNQRALDKLRSEIKEKYPTNETIQGAEYPLLSLEEISEKYPKDTPFDKAMRNAARNELRKVNQIRPKKLKAIFDKFDTLAEKADGYTLKTLGYTQEDIESMHPNERKMVLKRELPKKELDHERDTSVLVFYKKPLFPDVVFKVKNTGQEFVVDHIEYLPEQAQKVLYALTVVKGETIIQAFSFRDLRKKFGEKGLRITYPDQQAVRGGGEEYEKMNPLPEDEERPEPPKTPSSLFKKIQRFLKKGKEDI